MKLDPKTQKKFAQYLTHEDVATFMSDLFSPHNEENKLRILDPGAGTGRLGISTLKKYSSIPKEITFVELEPQIFDVLEKETNILSNDKTDIKLVHDSFIDTAISWIENDIKFDKIILNPPYFKIGSNSEESLKLKKLGIRVPNIYAGFMWLSSMLLERNGEMVAIVPRSFFNGLYFNSFRDYLSKSSSLEFIHVFNLRDKVFGGDSVLQESVIVKIRNNQQSDNIIVSYSDDHSFNNISKQEYYSQAIWDKGNNKFIRIPSNKIDLPGLEELDLGEKTADINVSTGPVVDFRLTENISQNYIPGYEIPLLYPAHMKNQEVQWPLERINKYGQFYRSTKKSIEEDSNVLPLNGYYVVVRRISSKEEKKRIVASVVSPKFFNSEYITFENHLNYFHFHRSGLDENIAKGLCVYLNSFEVNNYFSSISGSTQVNVTDLRAIPLPSVEKLSGLSRLFDETNKEFYISNHI